MCGTCCAKSVDLRVFSWKEMRILLNIQGFHIKVPHLSDFRGGVCMNECISSP